MSTTDKPLVLMLGDSLIDYGEWHRRLPGYRIISSGIPWERTEAASQVFHDRLHPNQYHYAFLPEEYLVDGRDHLSPYAVLLLPFATNLPDELTDPILKWVRGGGTLVMLGPALRRHPCSLIFWLAAIASVLDTILFMGNRTAAFQPGKPPRIGSLPRLSFYRAGRALNRHRRRLRRYIMQDKRDDHHAARDM